MRYFLLYKPYGMLCQFTRENPDDSTLKDVGTFPPDVYPVGRLDKDSEGLLLLTDDKTLTSRLLHPSQSHEREYWVQVEGIPTDEALRKLESGVRLKEFTTLPAKARRMSPPLIPARNPPIRYRKNVPDSWISLTITEGKNRQVRRMTAAVGFPTLRLVRYRIGGLTIDKMLPGEAVEMTQKEIYNKLSK